MMKIYSRPQKDKITDFQDCYIGLMSTAKDSTTFCTTLKQEYDTYHEKMMSQFKTLTPEVKKYLDAFYGATWNDYLLRTEILPVITETDISLYNNSCC